MTSNRPSPATRFTIWTLLVLGVAASWFIPADGDRPGLWVLGRYRTRWFVLNAGLTWGLVWATVWALIGLGPVAVRRLALAHVGVLLSIGIAEGASFLGLVDYREVLERHAWSPDAANRLRRVTPPGWRFEGQSSPDLSTWLSITADPVPTSVSTDANGLRNKEALQHPDVVCLGDSLLVARLVPTDEILTERLARELDARVYNVSESGYSPQEELIRLRLLELELEGTQVVQFIFEGNDLSDSKNWRAWGSGAASAGWPQSGLLAAVVERLRWAPPGVGRDRVGYFRGSKGDSVPVYFLYDADQVEEALGESEVLESVITGAHEHLEAQGASYSVAFIPMKLRVLQDTCRFPPETLVRAGEDISPLSESIRAECLEAGIPFLDLTAELRAAAAAGQLPYFAEDTHLNSHGHGVVAGAVAEWLRGRRALEKPGAPSGR